MTNYFFSPIQKKLLKILGNKKMKFTTLAEMVYADELKKPVNPANSLRSTIPYINWKCDMHRLKWKLQVEGIGRSGSYIKKVSVKWD